jgi:hypothetical protein
MIIFYLIAFLSYQYILFGILNNILFGPHSRDNSKKHTKEKSIEGRKRTFYVRIPDETPVQCP